MGRVVLVLLMMVEIGSSSYACTFFSGQYTSVQSGSWDVAATWGTTGTDVPGNNDHVTISTGDSVYHNNQETVGRLRIESGAVLYSSSDIRVNRSYSIYGAHRASARIRIRQNVTDSIIGTGFIRSTQAMRIDAPKQIYPGSSITIKSTDLRLPNNGNLTNSGSLTMVGGGTFTGNGSGTLIQSTNSVLTTDASTPIPGGDLDASATTNLVILNAATTNQTIPIPVSSYWDLTLNGNASTKSLGGRTFIDNDLKINGPILTAVDTFSIVLGHDLDVISGTFDAQNGLVEFNGAAAQSIKGNVTFNDIHINSPSGVTITQDSSKVAGRLWLDAGSLNTSNRLTILSNANGDGSIGPISGGSISGDVTVQRYIGSDSTNWRFLGSPTTNATISDWQDDFFTAGYPGSLYPSFNFESILGYDETVLGFRDSGAVSVSSTDNIPSGTGFWVFCGDSLGGTAPFTIDVTGPIYQGVFNFSVTYTGAFGNTDNGWNLLANPYASAIDWDHVSWSRSNVDDAIYMWNAEQKQYATYVAGTGTNGGSNIIPQGHGFYVKASNSPASLSTTEQAKVDTTIAFLKPRRNDDLVLRLRMEQGRFKDETIIRSNTSATQAFDNSLDAYHFAANGGNPLQLFSQLGANDFAINVLDLSKVDTVPILLTGKKGNALLHISIENQHSSTCLYLWDRIDNELFSIADQDVVELEIEGEDVYHKYSLIVRNNQSDCGNLLGYSTEVEAQTPKWAYYNGTDIVLLDKSVENNTYQLFGLQGQLVKQGVISSGRINCSRLAGGLYFLRVGDLNLKFVNP